MVKESNTKGEYNNYNGDDTTSLLIMVILMVETVMRIMV